MNKLGLLALSFLVMGALLGGVIFKAQKAEQAIVLDMDAAKKIMKMHLGRPIKLRTNLIIQNPQL